jgi:hypothetical protein
VRSGVTQSSPFVNRRGHPPGMLRAARENRDKSDLRNKTRLTVARNVSPFRGGFRAIVWSAVTSALASAGCDSNLVVGSWDCPWPSRAEQSDGGMLTPLTDIVPVPWGSSFETGLCDYDRAHGFCYTDSNSTFQVVASPVHSGSKAMAFTVNSDAASSRQARCVREGVLPPDAVYGAWFFVPARAKNTGNWNLMHFQGGPPPDYRPVGWWDVSLVNATDGGLVLQVVDYLVPAQTAPVTYLATNGRQIPIGAWFHLEFRLSRATDATGSFELRQDGVVVVQDTAIPTGDADWGQWYVGNWANGLDPPESTVYVDDVSIRAVN